MNGRHVLRILFYELFKGREAPFDHIGFYAIGNPYVARAAETVCRYDEQIQGLGLFRKGY